MLHRVPALVGRHRCRRHGVHVIHRLAEVDRLPDRVVVVGQLPGHAHHPHVVDPVLAQHRLGHLGAGHPQRNLRILVEPRLEGAADRHAGQGGQAHDQPVSDPDPAEAAGLLGLEEQFVEHAPILADFPPPATRPRVENPSRFPRITPWFRP